jgi:hypothetical protein
MIRVWDVNFILRHFWRQILSVIFLIFNLTVVFAAESKQCEIVRSTVGYKTVNLKNAFATPRNQTDVNWCYAYAAADLMTFELHRFGLLGKSEAVSANYTALLFNRRVPAPVMANAGQIANSCQASAQGGPAVKYDFERETGFSGRAMFFHAEGNICRESQIRSDIANYPLKSLLRTFLRLYRKSDRSEVDSAEMISIAKMVYPALNEATILGILNESPADPLMKLSEVACDTQHPVNASFLNKRLRVIVSGPNFISHMSNLLERGQPIILNHRMAMMDPNEQCSNHAVVVTGKKYNCETGDSDFFIRNSWGLDGCAKQLLFVADPQREKTSACLKKCGSGAHCEAVCRAKVTSELKNPPFRCEHGDFVFTASQIATHGLTINYYEPLN